MESSRRLAAIMFTDIVGYTTVMSRDENEAFALLERNRKVHKPLIDQFGGTFLKEMGDGILASFDNSSDAVMCAAAIQSEARQAQIKVERAADNIASEIVTARADVISYRRQITATADGVAAADKSYQLNARRVQEGEGLPLELLQSIRARAAAADEHAGAIADYNRAQLRLMHAIGNPPAAGEEAKPR